MQNKESAALFSVDKEQEEKYENEDWFIATGLGQLGWTKFAFAVWRKLMLETIGAPVTAEALKPTDFDLIEFMHAALAARAHTRIAVKGKNFSVFIPVGAGPFNATSLMHSSERFSYDPLALIQTAESKLRGITDPENGMDVVLDADVMNVPFAGKELGFEEDEELDQLTDAIKSVRLNAAPSATKMHKSVTPTTLDAWANGTADSYQQRTYVNALFTNRQAVMYFELSVSEAAATHICQGRPSLGVLAEYFGRMLEWLFGDEKEYVHTIVPISKIAKQNEEMGVKPVSRTDENGLAVDSKGHVLWLPDVENSEFIEAEIEQGGIQPDGDWTRLDAIDPEKNEYLMAPGINGRMVRQRKPKGRNRLIYTDWHNSRLSFTDDDGKMQLLDLSMYRKATPGQMADILQTRLQSTGTDGKTSVSHLQFAIERGAVSMGIHADFVAADFDRYFSEDEATSLLQKLNTGHLADYLLGCQQRMQRIHSTGLGVRQWTADELNAFDPLYEQWVTLDQISVDSPMPLLRPVAAILQRTFAEVMKDPALVFGRYAVRSTLQEMATLLVVAKYAGKYADLRALDMENRGKYLEPKLDPIHEIEIRDIPYVSGSVELFPHQVKAWNYLKNAPENVVLDVAAGGGKTLLALLDIAYHIGRGMLRPLVICPGDLIKNYINDAQWLFKGKMNMVVLNGTTFNSKEWGEENLRQLANNSPVNTIFLTDYDFIIPKAGSKRMVNAMYGTEKIRISLNNEFLKGIEWGGIWMDESHLTKNAGSSTNKELQRLVSTIPFKRQLSGTYISDNLTDVVGEFSLINPQTFGTMEDFEDEYYSDGRRSAPVPGAQRRIREEMSKNANVITIRRKEWAAILPRRSDAFHPVYMTENQKAVYGRILAAQKEALLEKTATDAQLRAALSGGGLDEDGNAIEVGELLDGQLSFVFQRLEQFVTAPSSDELGKGLSGGDRRSPKLDKIEEIIRRHLASNIPGKILVWTQYVESAANVFKMLSPDLQAMSVHYKAGAADQAMSEFSSNPGKVIMIGCEKSMNTGHNLQFCSRIIRLETVWNWGTLEQGESRINRPKTDDPRRHENGGQGIFYDWVFCDESIDVTKNARMISKLISTIKFYEQNNQAYQDLDEVEPVPLTQENIFSVNKWDDPDPMLGCERHFKVYEQYQQLEQQEFDDFVNDPKNRIEPYTLEEGAILPNSGLLKRVPYVPQMQLYGQENLGLIPLMDYMSTEYSDKAKTVLLVDDLDWDCAGMKLHTEFGDCVARGFNKGRKSVRVTTPSGSSASVPITMAWVITKDVANGTDMRQRIGKKIGAQIDQEIVPKQIKLLKNKDVRVTDDTTQDPSKTGQRAPADNAGVGFDMFLDTYNEYLALVVNSSDPDVAANIKDFEALGFIQIPDYHYSLVRNWKTLEKWIAQVEVKASIHAKYLAEIEEQIELWKKNKTMERFAQGLAAGSKKRFLTDQKTAAPKGEIRPYLVTHNDEVFLCLNARVNAATINRAKSVAVPGVKWKLVTGEHWMFGRSKQEIQTVLKQMFQRYTVTNREEVVKELAAARIVKVK